MWKAVADKLEHLKSRISSGKQDQQPREGTIPRKRINNRSPKKLKKEKLKTPQNTYIQPHPSDTKIENSSATASGHKDIITSKIATLYDNITKHVRKNSSDSADLDESLTSSPTTRRSRSGSTCSGGTRSRSGSLTRSRSNSSSRSRSGSITKGENTPVQNVEAVESVLALFLASNFESRRPRTDSMDSRGSGSHSRKARPRTKSESEDRSPVVSRGSSLICTCNNSEDNTDSNCRLHSNSTLERKRSTSNVDKAGNLAFMLELLEQQQSKKQTSSNASTDEMENPQPAKKWCVDDDEHRHVLASNFARRGWKRTSLDGDWNVFWATSKSTVENLFNSKSLSSNQFVNHYPNYYQLSRKDLMVLNIRKYKAKLVAENSPLAERDQNGNFVHLDIIPTTFILPEEHAAFESHFNSEQANSASPCGSIWILKPADKARGVGITLINSPSQIPKILRNEEGNEEPSMVPNWSSKTYVLSKYITNPLLVNQRKFDLRLYVLVNSFQPLRAYLYKGGFSRFCSQPYTNNSNFLNNPFVHLTNFAVQQNAAASEELKWGLNHLLEYVETTTSKQAVDLLWNRIKLVVTHSLNACRDIILNDEHSFEIFGYDILIDNNLKPWLIEINGSPSLQATDEDDFYLKESMISDAFNIIFGRADSTDLEANLGNFEPL